MSFKEQMLADLPAFFNVGEFADTIDVDGEKIRGVIDNDEAPQSAEGVTALESTLYTPRASFCKMPVVRQRITVDGRQANITRVDDQQEILVIRLQWFDS